MQNFVSENSNAPLPAQFQGRQFVRVLMKPESEPIAESKRKQYPRTESKLIQAEFKSETLFLYWFIMRIYR